MVTLVHNHFHLLNASLSPIHVFDRNPIYNVKTEIIIDYKETNAFSIQLYTPTSL